MGVAIRESQAEPRNKVAVQLALIRYHCRRLGLHAETKAMELFRTPLLLLDARQRRRMIEILEQEEQ